MGLFNLFNKKSAEVKIDNSCFTIVGNRLKKYSPQERIGNDEVIIPDAIKIIEKNAFNFMANVLEIHIPPSVTYIDDEAFRGIRFVIILGTPGSYAEEFVQKQRGGFLPSFTFYSNLFAESSILKYDPAKANATRYDDAIKRVMKFETVNIMATKPVTFPRGLFCAYNSSECDINDNVSSTTITIKMQTEGQLIAEQRRITYSAHNVAHCTTPRITVSDVTFDELPTLIANSNDPKSARYSGMTKENWREYFSTKPCEKSISYLPVVQFGRYYKFHNQVDLFPIDWFVLTEKDGYVLLLSRVGLDLCQYDMQHLSGKYTPNWKKSNLYRWLNNGFYSKAFDKIEKKYIRYTSLDIPRVFCLSKDEFKQFLTDDPSAQMKPSDYAQKKGAFVCIITSGLNEEYHKFEGNGAWWLRDEVGEGLNKLGLYRTAGVAQISDSGEIGWSFPDSKKTCIRPAIWVSVDYWKNLK